MNYLSPAAQAVLDAATSVKHPEIETVAFQCSRLEIAAALRAAADQLSDEMIVEDWLLIHAEDLLAIANELEGKDAE